MLTSTKSSNFKSSMAHQGGAKGGAANAPPSLAKRRTASGDDLAVSDINNSIVNLKLQEPTNPHKMGQATYNEKVPTGRGNITDETKIANKENNKNNTSQGGSFYKNINRGGAGKKNKKNQNGKGWKQQEQSNRRFEKDGHFVSYEESKGRFNDGASVRTCGFDWLDRINQNMTGIQGVVLLNEFGQPVVEYLPQDGFEYKVIVKANNNNNNNNNNKQDGNKKQRDQPSQRPLPTQQVHQHFMGQPGLGTHVFPGYPLVEGNAGLQSCQGVVMGNYAPQGYPTYMYSPSSQQTVYPMMMMMTPQPPSSPSRFGVPPHGMYAGCEHYQTQPQYFQPAQAEYGGGNNGYEDGYHRFRQLPPLPNLDETPMAEERTVNDGIRRVSVEPSSIEEECNVNGIPSVSPIPH
ncbi:hypothetical protein IV203_030970 [Nitzschia inconspicua]|uniref:Uncharacterized protein n=1 Tax=Nitzschia inconspicua TaxID=303405 RepID=A0A9K3PA41_9STRA|nr:hypothetical protein IV203_011202 [Nitzschia inconspicua]KAG7368227.1 hypothetical protein IV203_030970 [Nitzschia inconspicua]